MVVVTIVATLVVVLITIAIILKCKGKITWDPREILQDFLYFAVAYALSLEKVELSQHCIKAESKKYIVFKFKLSTGRANPKNQI